ncbi:MAG: endonuclease/exonuclease/phosphatase family protein [Actinomycetota bacterium]|nr:endonuclease/exonuclease/phosphatase family protein [Actinomycetota bacterium]
MDRAVKRAPGEVLVASFNVHAGIDGWGRPYDPLPGCLATDADVLLLVEAFLPDADEPGAPGVHEAASIAERLAREGGYELAAEASLARAALRHPPVLSGHAARRWAPTAMHDPGLALYGRKVPRAVRRRGRPPRARGTWNVLLFSRLPVRSSKVIPLRPLKREPLDRAILTAEVEAPAGVLTVVGTHFPHLSAGSPFRFDELRDALPPRDRPGVLMGDMNCFGPPLSLALPGWRRAVRGRTWPSWRRVAQPDHIFISRAVTARAGEVMPHAGSDHRPVRALLSFDGER